MGFEPMLTSQRRTLEIEVAAFLEGRTALDHSVIATLLLQARSVRGRPKRHLHKSAKIDPSPCPQNVRTR